MKEADYIKAKLDLLKIIITATFGFLKHTISKISKILINNIEILLKSIILITLIYFYFIVILFSLSNRPDPVLDYLKSLDLTILLPLLLLISSSLVLTCYLIVTQTSSLKTKHIDKIFHYLKKYESYIFLIPFSIICIGFLLSTLAIFDKFFVSIGRLLFFSGIICVYLMLIVKTYYESKIYCTLYRANDILKSIDLNNKNSYRAEKFSRYFTKFLNNLDNKLNKGIKIDELNKDNNKSSKASEVISIKNTITHYLPIFIRFGNQEQIFALKNRVNLMLTLVEKNEQFKLNITNIILDVYKDIENFLNLNGFPVIEHRRQINLSILKNKDLLTFIQTVALIIYIVVSGKSSI